MELNFKQFGQGEPIIILHGLFGMLDNWQTIAKKLAEEYTVFIIDQRNHGKSPHQADFSYPILAEDLKEFMEQNWIYESHIIGHSMGGKTAMQFALDYPDMVNKLVVVDIAPKKYVGGHQAIFEALFSLDVKNIRKRSEAEEKLAKRIPQFGVRQFLMKNLSRQKEGGFVWKMNLDSIYKHYQNILAEIEGESTDIPTLFINGGASKYVTKEDFPLIRELFPSAQFNTIENVGHWVHAEKPKELIQLVEDFLV